jgi:hypothetical protein
MAGLGSKRMNVFPRSTVTTKNRLGFQCSFRSNATGKSEALAVFSQVVLDSIWGKSERS